MIERGPAYVGFCGLLKLYKALSWQDIPFLLGIEPKRHKVERFKNCVEICKILTGCLTPLAPMVIPDSQHFI